MKRLDLELAVGVFVLLGIGCLGWISVRLGKLDLFGSRGYELHADFASVGGLKEGASVVIAGVDVGRVRRISLRNYQARVTLGLNEGLRLQEDTIASIRTKGLIGEKYVVLSPGSEEKFLKPGDRIREVESSVDLESLISKMIFESSSTSKEKK